MIHREGKRITIECDCCDETFKGDDGDDFVVVWGMAKSDGWGACKVANEWVHGCPKHKGSLS